MPEWFDPDMGYPSFRDGSCWHVYETSRTCTSL
ncbi:hypothetical protein SAMN05216176_10151 [Nitratireductor indicus]|nr:hypothetical protein SAMN05216176_10151 [Nitratireductor indicus]